MSLNLLGLATLALVFPQKGTDSLDALRRSFDQHAGVNVDAYVEKPYRGSDMMRVRFLVDAAGRRRTEVIGPLAMQGRVFIDDGTSYITYFPDRHLVQIHTAPPSENNLDRRMELIRRNYRLEMENKVTFAGRPALVIVAAPRDAALKTHRFTLDAATFVPLKTETVDALGNVTVKFRVSRISFPARFDRDTFGAPEGEGIRRETQRPPERVAFPGSREAEQRLGFVPAMPRRIKRFNRQGDDLLDWRGIKTMATKWGDGLVRLTVFQFRTGASPAPPPRPDEGPKVGEDVDGVRIEVYGDDVPVSVREGVLAAYVRILQGRAKAQDP